MGKKTHFNRALALSLGLSLMSLPGCMNGTTVTSLSASLSTTSTSSSPVPVSSAPPTARAARFIFQQVATGTSVPGGSFLAPPTNGTRPGSGHRAQYVFNADGTYLDQVGGTSWPSWISSLEVGVSGTANTASQNSGCANFASTVEPTLNNCLLGTSTSYTTCGAPAGQFRVSEADCVLGTSTTLAGNGGSTDGVYIKAVFNRSTSSLGLGENILVVMEYAAAALNPAPPDPTTCFQGSKFSPENCSDYVWRAYLKHSDSEFVQPYLILIPPTFSSVLGNVNSGAQASGLTMGSKQFILPLAGDSALTILQISRTQSSPSLNTSNLQKYCTPTGNNITGFSPLCSGVIFYTITFYRI